MDNRIVSEKDQSVDSNQLEIITKQLTTLMMTTLGLPNFRYRTILLLNLTKF